VTRTVIQSRFSNESLVESIFRKDPCADSASISKQAQLQQQAAKP